MSDKVAILKKVEMSLATMRPYLQKDGGDVEVVELSEDFILCLRFTGNCNTCSQTKMTSASIQEAIKNYISEIDSVIFVD